MVFQNNLLAGAAGATGTTPFDSTLIGNSVWLDGSADFFKGDDWAISADGRKEFIFSMWIQRNEFGRAQTHFDLIQLVTPATTRALILYSLLMINWDFRLQMVAHLVDKKFPLLCIET